LISAEKVINALSDKTFASQYLDVLKGKRQVPTKKRFETQLKSLTDIQDGIIDTVLSALSNQNKAAKTFKDKSEVLLLFAEHDYPSSERMPTELKKIHSNIFKPFDGLGVDREELKRIRERVSKPLAKGGKKIIKTY
jgi:hypothetical protein